MGRKVFDCRYVSSEINQDGCVFAVVGKDEEEVLAAQLEHGRHVHGAEDTPEVRAWIRAQIVDEAEWLRRRAGELSPQA